MTTNHPEVLLRRYLSRLLTRGQAAHVMRLAREWARMEREAAFRCAQSGGLP